MTALRHCGHAAIMVFRGFVTVQARGVIALPPELRRRYQLDEPGAQLEIIERGDGVFELHPVLPIPADQAWFWTDRWQQMEREADEDYAAGRAIRFDSDEAFLTYLDNLVDELDREDSEGS